MGRFRDAERHSHQTSSGWFTRLKTNARAIRRDVVNRLRALFGVVAKLVTWAKAVGATCLGYVRGAGEVSRWQYSQAPPVFVARIGEADEETRSARSGVHADVAA